MKISIIKKMIEKLLDKLLRFQSFQDYVNFRYNRKGHFPVSIEGLYYRYDTFFTINDQLFSIDEVINNYEFSDIKETDIVLDIGANIGAFTIFASKKAKYVFAVEPLYADYLYQNIKLNNINNVHVLDVGLGMGKMKIKYLRRERTVDCLSLSEIVDLCGGHIDFLKIDCEGGEWFIKPEELKEIMRIEAEVHNSDGKHNFNDFLAMLKSLNYDYKTKKVSNICIIIHAKRRHHK